MLNKTRCAISPYAFSGNPITPDIMTKIMSIWINLASALEDTMNMQEGEVLVWSLLFSGGEDAKPEKGLNEPTPPRAHADVELCKKCSSPNGCYVISSGRASGDQEILVRLAYDSTNILTDGLSTKHVGAESVKNVVADMVRVLRK